MNAWLEGSDVKARQDRCWAYVNEELRKRARRKRWRAAVAYALVLLGVAVVVLVVATQGRVK